MLVRGTVPVLVAGLLLLAGCTSSGGADSTTAASPTPTASTTTTPPPEPPPDEGACYRLRASDLQSAHNTKQPVKCRAKHTSQTFRVGSLPKKVVGNPQAINTHEIARSATRSCDQALRKHLGGRHEKRVLARFDAVWFVPDEEQFARGARWLRCDVVAHRTDQRLAELPRKTAGVLEDEDALDTWGTCAKASPSELESGDGHRICAMKHNWRAIDIQKLGKKSAPWPGAKELRQGVLDRCEKQVRSFTGNKTESADVGWLPPTRQQWKSGVRYGVCWARTR